MKTRPTAQEFAHPALIMLSPALPVPKIQEAGRPQRAVVVWLIAVYVMVFLMVLIGGITRLTGSGLSMVEWRPLMGAIPPLSEEAWVEVFEEYKAFPQYQKVNGWMDLAAFKKIFFWEYIHRLWGRLIGVAVFVPWLYFLAKKKLTEKTKVGALIAIALGGAQGVLGWYMVKSGLVDVPAVSHFRLAAHLLLALVVSQWLLWLILDLVAPWRASAPPLPGGRSLPRALLALLYLQITYGAFVAGMRAGFMSSTFPDMNGEYLPGAFFTSASLLNDLLHSPLAIHYTHRALGTLALLSFIGAGVFLSRATSSKSDRLLAQSLIYMVMLQFALGVITVVFSVPVPWAVAHQGGGVILLGLATALLHRAASAAEHSQPGTLRGQI